MPFLFLYLNIRRLWKGPRNFLRGSWKVLQKSWIVMLVVMLAVVVDDQPLGAVGLCGVCVLSDAHEPWDGLSSSGQRIPQRLLLQVWHRWRHWYVLTSPIPLAPPWDNSAWPSPVGEYQWMLGLNKHTSRCTSTVSVVSQCKLVSGWGLTKRRLSLGKDFTFFLHFTSITLCLNGLVASALGMRTRGPHGSNPGSRHYSAG